MKKRLLSICMILVMIFALTGCAGNKEEKEDSKKVTSEQETKEKETEKEMETEKKIQKNGNLPMKVNIPVWKIITRRIKKSMKCLQKILMNSRRILTTQ